MSDLDTRLAELAGQAGVDVQWRDANDRPQQVAPPTLRAVLDALGLPCANEADIDASLERLRREREGTQLPRLVVADAGNSFPLPPANAPRRYRIEDEQGNAVDEGTVTADERMLRAPASWGYYRLLIGEDECTLAAAPPRAFGVGDIAGARRRPWGVAVQLSSLRQIGKAHV